MTTPIEREIALQPKTEEVPVWQPEMLHAEPITAMNDAALEDLPAEATSDAPPPADAPAGPPAHVPARARRATSVSVLLAISAMIALGGVAFAVGRATSTGSTTGSTNAGANNGLVNGAPNGAGFVPNASGAPDFVRGGDDGFGPGAATVTGTVVSVTSNSITIQTAGGQTETIAIGSSTTYHAQTAATSSDVTTGATVVVKTSRTGVVPNTGQALASSSPGVTTAGTATDVTITAK